MKLKLSKAIQNAVLVNELLIHPGCFEIKTAALMQFWSYKEELVRRAIYVASKKVPILKCSDLRSYSHF